MDKSLFIVLDGIDGSGKSELVKKINDYLLSKNSNIKVLMTREPSDGKYGKEVREILVKETDPKSNAEEALSLFIKDREDHLKSVILPFLNDPGDGSIRVVICDRYYYSTIAFQATQGLDIRMLIEINKNFLKPDIAFILDLEPKNALERIKYRQKEKFEQLEFMVKLRSKFLELPRLLKDNIKIVNASQDRGSVFEIIKKEIDMII